MIHPAFADHPAINHGSCERRRLPPRSHIAFTSGRKYSPIAQDAWFLCDTGATMGAACIAKRTRCLGCREADALALGFSLRITISPCRGGRLHAFLVGCLRWGAI
ncbi:hypothetical protein BD311DRAFT_762337 [Dichomitus squalens]|uniref:Uncharacterized protein n=1 Tax=Dichomitus squalens TaxID=114155 RepID=A0A4Q9MGJ1_9APHY|nr:hypothetical protein BD311DRAFT_762337 [Dichomitus squalens]